MSGRPSPETRRRADPLRRGAGPHRRRSPRAGAPPGHRLLATAALTGVTAVRWAATQELLAALWADLATHRAVVADACAVRTRRPRPGEREWAELHELAHDAAPRRRRRRGVPRRRSRRASSAARMDGRLREVAAVLERPRPCTWRRWPGSARWPSGCATPGPARRTARPRRPRRRGARRAGRRGRRAARRLHERSTSLPARLPCDLVDGIDDDLAGAIDAIEARLAELAAARDAWAERRRAVADAVAALDTLCAREARARRAALDARRRRRPHGSARSAARAAPPAGRAARADDRTRRPSPRCPGSPRTSAAAADAAARGPRARDRADRPPRRARAGGSPPTARRRCGSGRPTTRRSSRSPRGSATCSARRGPTCPH